jgi:hypothetical protein
MTFVQSHEIELQMGINDWFLIQVTSGFEQPLGDNLQASEVEIEAEFALLKRQGDGIALSFQAGYEQAINHGAQVDGDPNQFGFGPIVELAKGPFLLTLNPLFTKQIGTFADQESLVSHSWVGRAAVGASQLTFLNPIACASGVGEALPFVSGTTLERGGKAAGGATDGTLPTSSFSNSMSLLIISSFTLALATFASRSF